MIDYNFTLVTDIGKVFIFNNIISFLILCDTRKWIEYSNTPLYRLSLYAHDVGGIDGLAV